MKALTICQPYASLIVTPPHKLPPNCVSKRVENRVWNCRYRGLLLIHAGKSTKWLETEAGFPREDLVFGAIVGRCHVVDCVELAAINDETRQRYPWLEEHPHASGPFCIILNRVRRLEKPVPYKGALGLFDVPDSAMANAVYE